MTPVGTEAGNRYTYIQKAVASKLDDVLKGVIRRGSKLIKANAPAARNGLIAYGMANGIAIDPSVLDINFEVHFVIPQQVQLHPAIKKYGFDYNAPENVVMLPNEKASINSSLPVHPESHPGYSAALSLALSSIPKDISSEEHVRAILMIQEAVRNCIEVEKIPFGSKNTEWNCPALHDVTEQMRDGIS